MHYKQYSEAVVYVGEVGDVPQPKTYYIHEPELRHINPEGTWTYKDGEKMNLSGKYDELRKTDIPCWSVGRLIKIYFICSYQSEILIDYTMEDLVDYLVSLFESVAMNFSKLEE
jgi:hypothetical protein